MPITPAHQWHESETWVSIDVKIPNVTTKSTDIITTDCYMKVNSAPYFFEVDFYGKVDSKMSKVVVGSGAVKFFLVKKEQGLWERLSMQGDRNMRVQRRQQSLEEIRKERENVRKEYPAKFSNIGRLAVGEQMRMEEAKRKIIEDRKEVESLMEQENIEAWKEDLTKIPQTHDDKHLGPPPLQEVWRKATPCDARAALENTSNPVEFTPREEKNRDSISSSLVGRSVAKDQGTFKNIKESCKDNNKNLDGCSQSVHGSQVNDTNSFLEETLQTTSPTVHNSCTPNVGNGGGLRYTGATLPAPRNCAPIPITFSPKPDLPKHLPARESRDREIKLKKSGKASEDALDVSERAPLFLQDKGDKFFKSGDYQSAVNAYTDALERDPSLVIAFANRGACKLQLKEYKACVQDCTTALCILTKGTPDCGEETILAQNLLVQEKIIAENSLIPSSASNFTSTSGVICHDDCVKDLVKEGPVISFPTKSLELLTCLSGQGCCSMRGLVVEGAGVEEWKLGMKKHMFMRRGVARYHVGDLPKAIDDFAKAVQIKPKNEEMERILKEVRMASVVHENKKCLSLVFDSMSDN